MGQALSLDTHAGVADGADQHYHIIFLLLALNGQGNIALGSVLHRVCHQIYEDLFDADLIAVKIRRCKGIYVHAKLQSLAPGLDSDYGRDIGYQLSEIIPGGSDVHLSGFDL